MIIKITKSIPDEYGNILPEMIGNSYEVLKETSNGVWVKHGKLEVLVRPNEFVNCSYLEEKTTTLKKIYTIKPCFY